MQQPVNPDCRGNMLLTSNAPDCQAQAQAVTRGIGGGGDPTKESDVSANGKRAAVAQDTTAREWSSSIFLLAGASNRSTMCPTQGSLKTQIHQQLGLNEYAFVPYVAVTNCKQ